MPRFTLDLSAAAAARLQALVTQWNENNGAALTVAAWLHMHVKELAIQDELMATANTLREQAEKSAADAFTAERQRLLVQ